jgi:hypothetical protein
MVLADSLEKKQTGDLLARISQNITIQREFLDVVRQEVDLEEVETYTSEQLRGQLRSLAVQQLEVLSQSQQLTKIAGREVDTLRGKTEKEQTPEEDAGCANRRTVALSASGTGAYGASPTSVTHIANRTGVPPRCYRAGGTQARSGSTARSRGAN